MIHQRNLQKPAVKIFKVKLGSAADAQNLFQILKNRMIQGTKRSISQKVCTPLNLVLKLIFLLLQEPGAAFPKSTKNVIL